MNYFDIKNLLDSNIYRAYNFAADFKFHLNIRTKKVLGRNEIFKDIHHGESCFIIGTGPSINSLTPNEINSLKNKTTIFVNSAYKADILNSIIPTYYSLFDNNYWGLSSCAFKDIADKYELKPPIFLTDFRAKALASSANGKLNLYAYAKNYPINSLRCDPCSNMSITMNVLSTSILLCMYMGFRQIYLLGCDFNSFCSPGVMHCYDDDEETATLKQYKLSYYLWQYSVTAEFHYLISILAKEMGVSVINITSGSLLDAYPIMDRKFFL